MLEDLQNYSVVRYEGRQEGKRDIQNNRIQLNVELEDLISVLEKIDKVNETKNGIVIVDLQTQDEGLART